MSEQTLRERLAAISKRIRIHRRGTEEYVLVEDALSVFREWLEGSEAAYLLATAATEDIQARVPTGRVVSNGDEEEHAHRVLVAFASKLGDSHDQPAR